MARRRTRRNPPRPRSPRPVRSRRTNTGGYAVAAVVVLAVLAAALVAIVRPFGGGENPADAVIIPPAHAAGISVDEPWADLGRVRLDTPVSQKYILRNTGANPVSLGKATIEVLEGC